MYLSPTHFRLPSRQRPILRQNASGSKPTSAFERQIKALANSSLISGGRVVARPRFDDGCVFPHTRRPMAAGDTGYLSASSRALLPPFLSSARTVLRSNVSSTASAAMAAACRRSTCDVGMERVLKGRKKVDFLLSAVHQKDSLLQEAKVR